jgi:hypothetical protein
MPPDCQIKRLKSCGTKSHRAVPTAVLAHDRGEFLFEKRNTRTNQRTGWRVGDYRIGRVCAAVRVPSSADLRARKGAGLLFTFSA